MDRQRNPGMLILSVLAAGVLFALALAPVAVAAGLTINSGHRAMDSSFQEIATANSPQTSQMTDRHGNVIATFYTQRRTDVSSDQISAAMKNAIVAIEDRRFYEHQGVDARGTLRALFANLSSGDVNQGASTLDQQYVKNYLALVSAKTDEERRAASEETASRKLREMKMAADLDDKFSKEEILTRYLNLVDFGNTAFGVQEAAHTYFNVDAKDLTIPQAALLAGIVQSTSGYNPYQHPEAALERRNTVIDSMVTAGNITAEEAEQAKNSPLGITPEPTIPTNGCIGAGNAGFFCDYALKYLASHGISKDDFIGGGYTLKTTLDATALESVDKSLQTYADPQAQGVSQAMSLINPHGHEVLAIGSSRDYGLDEAKAQTVLPLPASAVGNGAGSIFKVFAAAAALEKGMGLNTVMGVPSYLQVSGMGHGGAAGCPADMYCVQNAGAYAAKMTLQDALAQSPNTPFVELEKRLGVPTVVDTAVKMGLRSLAEAPEGQTSQAQQIKDTNQGSFVLGPVAVDPLELANVGATIADNGQWCEPNPILSVTDAQGKNVSLTKPKCEQAISADVAHALAAGLSKDVTAGTAKEAAGATGWSGALASKTGTTETSQSSAFLGLNSGLAGAVYAFNDGGQVTPLCTSPLRQCSYGNLFGGEEPARTYMTAVQPLLGQYGGAVIPQAAPQYVTGTNPEALGYSRNTAPTTGGGGGGGSTASPAAPGATAPDLADTITGILRDNLPPELQGLLQ